MKEEQEDFYTLLGVEPDVSERQLRISFRKLAQRYHPDTGSEEAKDTDIFKKITEAYQTLSDPELRNQYNKEYGYEFYEDLSRSEPEATESEDNSGSVPIFDSENDWSHLFGSVTEDLGVEHKVGIASQESDSEEIDLKGEFSSVGETSGVFGSLGSRKGGSSSKRRVLKSELKETFAKESNPDHSKATESRKTLRPIGGASERVVENPLAGERVYQFQITQAEAVLGCARELVLGDASVAANRVAFDIPAGVEDSVFMEISRGWDRVNVQITVVEDEQFLIDGLNLIVRIPVTLKEWMDGADFKVPGAYGSARVNLRSGIARNKDVVVEGAGLSTDSAVGDLHVRPYIVPPKQVSSTLELVSKVVDKHLFARDLSQVLSESRGLYRGVLYTRVFLPITFSEAMQGYSVDLSIDEVAYQLSSASFNATGGVFQPEKQSNEKQIKVFSEILAPEKSSNELQEAALAVEQHYLASPRSKLPSSLLQKK